MWQKFKSHLFLSFVFLFLTLAQQYLFYWLKGLSISFFSPEKYLVYFVFFLVVSFSSGPKIRFFLFNFFLILNLFQMSHLSYFGTRILPSGIYLLFTQFHEISGTLITEWHHVVVSLVFTLLPILIGLKIYRKVNLTRSHAWVTYVLLFYLAYNPARTFFTGNTWGRQPTLKELDGMNMYLSLSYFLGRVLPAKIIKKDVVLENESTKLKLNPGEKSVWDNVIVVVGESLSPNHMSLFGYDRKTTPFLESLKSSSNFFALKGLSSGVSSDISIAFFFNLTYGGPGSYKMTKGHHCLFRLAKENHFSTYFYSIQDLQSLRYTQPYLCNNYLDEFKTFENLSFSTQDSNKAVDRDLIVPLKKILSQKKSKNFIVLHQRGSHAPWELRFTKEARIFTDSKVDKRINDYDNSVVEFDLFWKELDQALKSFSSKTLVLYLSDHGESLGVDKKFGHGFLAKTSFEIPMLFLSYNQALPDKLKQLPNFLTQFSFSLALVRELGWTSSMDPLIFPKDYEIFGNDIDGFAGKAGINFHKDGSYTFNCSQTTEDNF